MALSLLFRASGVRDIQWKFDGLLTYNKCSVDYWLMINVLQAIDLQ